MSGAKRRRLWWFEQWQLEEQESWLSDQARLGWHLEGTRPFATFRQGPPREMRYRCEVATDEDEERMEIYRAAGWEYVGRRSDLQIYRAPLDGNLPEIHTDQTILAKTIRQMQLRLILGIVLMVGQLALGVAFSRSGGRAQFMLLLGLRYSTLLPIAFLVYFLGVQLFGILHLSRLIAGLRRGRPLKHRVHYQAARRLGGLTAIFAAVTLTVVLVTRFSDGGNSFPPIPTGELPMVRLTQIMDAEGRNWQRSDWGESVRERAKGDVFNYYHSEWGLLVPEQARLHERLRVLGEQGPEGGPYEPWLQSCFYRARSAAIARVVATELLYRGPFALKRSLSEPDVPALAFSSAETSLWLHVGQSAQEFILQHGDRVWHVFYWGNGEIGDILRLTAAKADIEIGSSLLDEIQVR